MGELLEEAPVRVNLFPLRVDPEKARLYRLRSPAPEKLLGFLRATGWYAHLRGTEIWVYGLEAPEAKASLLSEERVGSLRERILALNISSVKHPRARWAGLPRLRLRIQKAASPSPLPTQRKGAESPTAGVAAPLSGLLPGLSGPLGEGEREAEGRSDDSSD